MEQYIVSARKYRPTTFESVVGQRSLTDTLRNAIRTNHLAHAYLFCGPRGVGKTTCARIFAKTINCLHPTQNHDACNECESCVAFNEQRSFNIHELDAASNNSVEDIRNLIQEVRIPPQIGKYSVYIIDEVHMLTTGAFNALLKTLEEPPAYAVFILATTEKHKVTPTILSRCQVYDFQRMSVRETIDHLKYVAEKEHVLADEQALNIVAQKADGGMRDALSIFDQLVAFCNGNITYQQTLEILNVLDTDYYFRLVDALFKADISTSLLLFNEILQKGFDAGCFVTGFAQHLRDVLVSKDPATTALIETSDSERQHYKEQATAISARWILKALEIINTCDIQYRTAKNKRLTIELSLMRVAQLTMPTDTPSTTNTPQPQSGGTPTHHIQTTTTTNQKTTTTTPAQQSIQPNPSKTTMDALPKIPSIHLNTTTTIPHLTETKSEQPTPIEQNNPFTQDQLNDAWVGLKKNFPKEERLLAMLSENLPSLTNNTLTLHLANPWQKEEFARFEKDIMNYIHQQLHNNLIRLHVEVDKYTPIQQAYTASDKYKLMVGDNPSLAYMKKTLELQLE